MPTKTRLLAKRRAVDIARLLAWSHHRPNLVNFPMNLVAVLSCTEHDPDAAS